MLYVQLFLSCLHPDTPCFHASISSTRPNTPTLPSPPTPSLSEVSLTRVPLASNRLEIHMVYKDSGALGFKQLAFMRISVLLASKTKPRLR